MDFLSNLKYAKGSRKKRKRIGRGEGSGHGGTATRGENGQRSRSGAPRGRARFEGGQMPLQRRIPKFGFTNIFKVYFQVVNVSDLQKAFDNNKLNFDKITAVELEKAGLVSSTKKPVKILGDGNLSAKLNLEVNSFSKSAQQKIEAAGGTVKKVS